MNCAYQSLEKSVLHIFLLFVSISQRRSLRLVIRQPATPKTAEIIEGLGKTLGDTSDQSLNPGIIPFIILAWLRFLSLWYYFLLIKKYNGMMGVFH